MNALEKLNRLEERARLLGIVVERETSEKTYGDNEMRTYSVTLRMRRNMEGRGGILRLLDGSDTVYVSVSRTVMLREPHEWESRARRATWRLGYAARSGRLYCRRTKKMRGYASERLRSWSEVREAVEWLEDIGHRVARREAAPSHY